MAGQDNRIKLFIHYLKTAMLIGILLATGLSSLSVSAAGPATVVVSGPGAPINPGTQFSVSINLQPNNAIAGAQFDLSFNPSLITIDSVEEGTLLNINGASTYFVPGVINNTTGTVTGVTGAIITPGQTVSTQGVFAVITMTSLSTRGTSVLTLSNVVVGDLNAQPVLVNIINSNIVIADAGSSTELEGADGDGDNGSLEYSPPLENSQTSFTSHHQESPGITNNDGVFIQNVSVKSGDNNAHVVINKGIKGLKRDGNTISNISIANTEIPEDVQDVIILGAVYDISPDGAIFDKPVRLNLNYNPAVLPAGVDEKDLFVGTWDPEVRKWNYLESQTNFTDHILSTNVNHFSIYAVLALKPNFVESTLTSKLKDMEPVPSSLEPNPTVELENIKQGLASSSNLQAASSDNRTDIDENSSQMVLTETTLDRIGEDLIDEAETSEAEEFSLSLLAEIIGGACILIGATTFVVLFRRRVLLNPNQH